MKFRTRIFIALGFIVAFLIVAPPLIWYSSGLRYDWAKREWFNPGWIILETVPNAATVFINGRDIGLKTPATIKNLRPDDYLVEIKLEGRHSWQKRLSVKAGLATFAKHIKLFKVGEPEALTDLDGSQIIWHQSFSSANLEKIALIKRRILNQPPRFSVFDLGSGKIGEIDTDGQEIEDVVWDDDAKNALVKFPRGQFGLYERGESVLKPLPIPSLENWQFIGSKNQLWGMKNDRIFKIELASQKVGLVATISGLQNFKVSNGRIFILRDAEQADSTYLEILQADGAEKIISRLPKSKYLFVDGAKERLTLIDHTNRQVYVIRPSGQELVLPEFIASASGAIWNNQGDRLLYWNDFEIWIWNAQENLKELIERLGEKIILARWYPGQEYILFGTGQEVRAIELDSRDRRNVATLSKIGTTKNGLSGPVELLIAEKGDKMYLIYPAASGLIFAAQEIL